MRRISFYLATLAVATFSFSSCQKEKDVKNDPVSHVVNFKAGLDATKTTMSIDGSTVTYSWDDLDQDTENWFKIYEGEQQANYVTTATGENGLLEISAIFPTALPSGKVEFTGVMNGTIPASQKSKEDATHYYDRLADVLIAKGSATVAESAKDINDVVFQFKRVVAISKMTIKGLPVESIVNNVTVSSETPLIGDYDITNNSWSDPKDNTIDIACDEIVETEDGGIVVYFVSRPVENASITVNVTADGVNYTKTTSAALTLTEGNVKGYTVRVAPAVSIANTKETAYTTAEAIALIEAGNDLDTEVYVKGTVKSISWNDLTKYGNADITLATENDDTFKLYRCYDKDNAKFTSEYLKAKDQVIAYGKLTKFEKDDVVTYELQQGCYLVDYVEYVIPVTSVGLPESKTVEVGQSFDMDVVVKPSNATNPQLTWVSDNEVVATVNQSGHVEALAAGTATITATSTDGTNLSSSCVITVNKPTEAEPVYPEVEYDFSEISGIEDWGTAYNPRTVEYDNATVSFASVNTSTSTITGIPVTKGGSVTVTMKQNARISSLYFECKQWGDKNQTISLYTSTDGSNFTKTEITSDNFILAAENLSLIKAIRFDFSSSSNQIGIAKLYLNKMPSSLKDVEVSFDSTPLQIEAGSRAYFNINTEYDGTINATSSNNNLTVSVNNKTLTVNAVNAAKDETAIITLSGNATATCKSFSSNVNVNVIESTSQGEEKTATIKFGSATGSLNINAATVSGEDSEGNSWTVTTVGTTSFTPNSGYAQVGSSKSAASSITFTMTLPSEATITDMSAKFGGFSSTAGSVSLKVGQTEIGAGSLNGTSDVTINSTTTQKGTVITVSVTGIAKGVKCYEIVLSYK